MRLFEELSRSNMAAERLASAASRERFVRGTRLGEPDFAAARAEAASFEEILADTFFIILLSCRLSLLVA